MRVIALLMAAGSGSRFGAAEPKQYSQLLGCPILRHAAEALLADGAVQALLPVVAAGEEARVAAMLEGLPCLPPVAGGATRQDSVRAGLEALAASPPDAVLVHDGARPVLPRGTVPALLAALEVYPGAIPAQPVTDTLKAGAEGAIQRTVPRAGLYRAQTPQAFRFPALLQAHRDATAEATDDAALLEAAGLPVALLPGSESNLKVTYPEDLARAEAALLPRFLPAMGTGFDVHRLVEGRPLILCGVTIPHPLGLDGHSDADVGLHALCDAIYGALAEGDIGRHFPPSDMEWKDADSARFLRHAAGRVAARGGMITHADVTLICEKPKIGPHAEAMRARLAELMGIPVARVSVKATTTERLGFTGRGEGIAAQAAATLLLPSA
ncbi:bifunctional 2-C-methyl-D-erythritol 4-phosphate cytidylyltransferase/2-C-methyl-D-erythritol 2,4-cyclodiphosphate synthase [Pseudoroseomonas wenyumeiae]|uniref:Bifunctional enzyme IspD/IspF n=1 Tax=Teichococcus wenyumeiae TaxID=2478470 RepID=A0A3A9JAE7_9PROT|nr:bifunctional 2-C-methyl-D-erythritol 4-phosphate cytidylyltransferase/2-C-methyl-D-erythritol 2,4-cyclodiphosphate synthase [Pseudoroseomonas wenyumeiae]RKK04257.1 bifunctional 2-C-methyl-D-erythritol 4-phosphate cytidylyltransferase/2-C-methyl-D-erythritol 2,4-cyclodiphosphate synthase [Pseudoroseomonas wenyumeiae]RMI19184.1 bifunctional 2-C-methyl-D-erythritol 4-phosphate cytidylyltransferase/2-C-methyl-D-erythritol 2,4-cyclodiphosphate synthase [Pseudoroseomonas wenyumeiae]